MEKINGMILDGKIYEAIKGECGKQCSFYNDGYLCQIFREFCKTEDCYFRYSPELTDKINCKPTKRKRMCLRDKNKVCDLCHKCDIDISQPNY